jgi:phage shock protein PspC (stress-responsive transcriptional regulator)
LVWIAALTPIAYRHYTDRQATASVERFSYRNWLVRRANPAIGMYEVNSTPHDRAERRMDVKAQIRNERQRIQRRRERRRRVLAGICGTIAASLVLGAVPALRMLWLVALAVSVLGAAYVYVLVSVARSEALNLERLRKIVPLGTDQAREVESHVLVAAGGARGPLYSTPMPRRPAFVVLKAVPR